MERRFVVFLCATAAFTAVLLPMDHDGLPQQLALGLATAAFLWLFARRLELDVRQLLWCIAVATTGEVVLSLGWRLYSYAHAVIPLYVPPGHGIFYSLAAVSARQPLFRRYAAAITRGVVAAGTFLALVSLFRLDDVWGFVCWIGALALMRISRNRLLLSACVVYTMILEWIGTALGNWRWAAEVPYVGVHAANPPAGVGILYILLDLIVVAITAAPSRTDSPPSAPCAVPARAAAESRIVRTAGARRA